MHRRLLSILLILVSLAALPRFANAYEAVPADRPEVLALVSMAKDRRAAAVCRFRVVPDRPSPRRGRRLSDDLCTGQARRARISRSPVPGP